MPLGLADQRAFRRKPELLPGAGFGHGEADPGHLADRHPHGGKPATLDQALEYLAGDATGQVEGHGLAAQLADHPRHVDAAATRIVALVAGTYLVHRHYLVGDAGSVDGGVHGEGDDRLHAGFLAVTRPVPSRPKAAAAPGG